jgi:hypothetical protein
MSVLPKFFFLNSIVYKLAANFISGGFTKYWYKMVATGLIRLKAIIMEQA